MNILDTIIAHKQKEVAARKASAGISTLEKRALFSTPVLSLREALLAPGSTGIIAEFKRRSPSKGIINDKADVTAVTKAYTANGAACLSVLTDEQFFGGSDADLQAARVNCIPILRKEFIIDEYQVTEAKSLGADVILLIAACLSPQRVKELATCAAGLGLEVLLELHTMEELEHICAETTIIGINNRNLKTFAVDIDRSLEMAEALPAGTIKVAESGISSPEVVRLFRESGFRGFLVGERFMKELDPGAAFKAFAESL